MPKFLTGGLLAAIVVVLVIVILCLLGYVKAPPDVAFIISGARKKPKILIGRAGVKIPFFERKDQLLLKQISIDIKTNGYVPTLDFIGVNIDAVAKVRVMTDPEGITKAMKNFLNMKEADIIKALTDSLQGNMREIIGTVRLKELNTDRKKFGDEVQAKAQTDMKALGIEIISCNIQEIRDEKGLILALGQDNMSQIQKDASISKANAERDVSIAQAEAKKAANEAQVNADTDIAIKQNELKIKQAELKKEADMRQAEADAAYKIQEEEQRKTIEITSANANIARQEKEAELAAKKVAVQERNLEAEIKKKADADKYRREQAAAAELVEKQRIAEAHKFEAIQEAEAKKALADAKMYEAQKEAEAIRMKGLAEAEATKAKLMAEADGTEAKAEAMKKMGEASILEMYFNILPDMVKNAAEPLSAVDSITMYGSGNEAQLTKGVMTTVNQVTDGISGALGFDMKSVIAGFVGGRIADDVKKSDDDYREVKKDDKE